MHMMLCLEKLSLAMSAC